MLWDSYGLVGLVILILDIWAIVNVLGAAIAPLPKLGWILLILFLPVVGLIIWLIAGPRGRGAPA
jgi:hypothetical protein